MDVPNNTIDGFDEFMIGVAIPQRQPYRVLVRVDGDGRITAINSSAFITDETGWTQIDVGVGDRYHHAQGNYLPKSLYDDRGIPRYKLVDGQVVERTQEEIDADYTPPEVKPTAEELLAALMEGIENA